MRVCVVGGTGNISTSIVRRLLERGHDVTCFNRGNVSPHPDVRVLTGDRSDRHAFEETMQREGFDAAIDMISFDRQDAQSSIRAFRDVGHFIHCSTVDTYGRDCDWLPVDETHPLRPHTDYARNKIAADDALLAAHHTDGFPVTIIKPSTTYGVKMGLPRQISWEFSWLDRIRKGKPIVICGDGNAIHQFLHADDAALCFAGVLEHPRTIGRTYNMTNRGFTTWAEHHRTAMKVIGQEVELIGIPLADLARMDVPNFAICRNDFAHHCYHDSSMLFRDVPEFQPRISLEEGMRRVLEAMDRDGRIPPAESSTWEDELIAAARSSR